PCPGFTSVTSTPIARPDVTTGAEGTAMLEIIHDIAPGADLFFGSAEGLTDLEHRRARRCLTEVVDIIADDIAFFNAGSYDGTSPVSLESTASVISGVVNFISVGNQARVHYQGIYADTDDDSLHEFDASLGLPFNNNSGETLNIGILPLEIVTIFLQWNDPFGGSNNDYDLLITAPADPDDLLAAPVLFASQNQQNGDDNPTEAINIINGITGVTVGIVILNFDANVPKEFDMFVIFNNIFGAEGFLDEFIVAQSSVPNNGDADLVLSIGSIGLEPGTPLVQGIDEIRSYSSQGPTNDGRIKPELVAPDGVSVTGAGGFSTPFFGTSAAAPHAAGVAALLLEAEENLSMAKSGSILPQTQSLSPSEISNILRDSAVDLGTPGADNTFGSGRIDAFVAVQSVAQQPTPTPSPSPSPTPTTQPPPTDQDGDGSGGCSISPTAQVGTAVINILIPLFSALVIALRIFRKKTLIKL
ncbi:MAG: S8 family serine peptidase, partial [Thermodesulfobacteriota bacterium]